MTKKIKLELTKLEMSAILSIITTIEGMYGCGGDIDNPSLGDWDMEMKKDIKKFDSMLKRNNLIRK